MRFNRKGLATITLLGGVLAGALVGAGVTWTALRPVPALPHVHEVTTHGEWVKYTNAKGDSVRAYVAYPERKDKAPVIIVIHEIFGLTDWEPTVVDDYAAKGYIAIVPDLLSSRFGISPARTDSGSKLTGQLAQDGVNADLDATYKYVTGLPAANKEKVGLIGFCWGGGNVWKYASTNPNLKAAIACYGPVSDTTMIKKVKAPVFAIYGENDARVNANMADVAKAMASARLSLVQQVYKGMGHGFLHVGRPGADSPEATRARADIDAFFAKHLEGK